MQLVADSLVERVMIAEFYGIRQCSRAHRNLAELGRCHVRADGSLRGKELFFPLISAGG